MERPNLRRVPARRPALTWERVGENDVGTRSNKTHLLGNVVRSGAHRALQVRVDPPSGSPTDMEGPNLRPLPRRRHALLWERVGRNPVERRSDETHLLGRDVRSGAHWAHRVRVDPPPASGGRGVASEKWLEPLGLLAPSPSWLRGQLHRIRKNETQLLGRDARVSPYNSRSQIVRRRTLRLGGLSRSASRIRAASPPPGIPGGPGIRRVPSAHAYGRWGSGGHSWCGSTNRHMQLVVGPAGAHLVSHPAA